MPQTRVGAILQREGSIVFPGVYDTLSAKLVERAGFPMSFISGYSVAADRASSVIVEIAADLDATPLADLFVHVSNS